MPLSSIALAQILSARITALGAVPVVTELQREDAENLLWTQLLALLSNEASNPFLFHGPDTLIDVAVQTAFPGVTPFVLNDANFGIGTVLDIELSGTFNNQSGVSVGFSLGPAVGAQSDITAPITLTAGSQSNFKAWSRILRLTDTTIVFMDTAVVTADLGPPAMPISSEVAASPGATIFASGAEFAMTGLMTTASISVLITLSTMTLKLSSFDTIE